ncbi:helix-turn-helix domain-containing protein [Saccharothrix syringae]|uniref:helix-turn-helix domain-containing protein n=1 Tax=Saccharothrix syringae TaxID=103733 RepID=UPI00068EE30C|nr:helix-turn-helix domain-containing protein [Saccharothrix syringae]
MIGRPGLAEFLRRRREKLSPSEVGLPETRRRRTPGLRREEVAVPAGMSSDFYARLEQARGSDPSESVVAALARALRCTPDEKDHLFRLAGVPVPPRRNALDDALACRDERRPDRGSNVHRSWFIRQESRHLAPEADRARLSAAHVSDLRATYSRRGGDHRIAELVADLAAYSAECRT